MSIAVSIRGTLVEAGRDGDSDSYDISIRVEDERIVRISGLTKEEAKESAKRLYDQIAITVSI